MRYLFLFVMLFPSIVCADGLIYSLPPDGSWAKFKVYQHGWDIESLDGSSSQPKELELQSTLVLRSVGEEQRDGHDCRWIELETTRPPTTKYPGRIIVLKMLIPTRYLAAGEDPLTHVAEMYMLDRGLKLNEKPTTRTKKRISDPARMQYEIERFRLKFPLPPKEDVPCSTSTIIKTPFGNVKARRLSYPATFQGKLHGGKGGRWAWSGNYTLWLGSDSSFGLVAVECISSSEEEYATLNPDNGRYELNGNGTRMKSKVRVELMDVGTDAKSSLPQFPFSPPH